MYCPQCAAQCVDDAKFCRACGADLKAVALALAEQQLSLKDGKNKLWALEKEKTRLEKRSQGARAAAEGATMLAGSLLIGFLIQTFGKHNDPIAIWVVFFGWLACWGVFRMATGLGAVMQSVTMGSKAVALQPDVEPVTVPDTDPLADPKLSPPLSVTEHTTRSIEPANKEYAVKE